MDGARRADFAAIDAIKAAAIVAVLFHHAGPWVFESQLTVFDRILRIRWVDFHVPAFVFASGFLYRRDAPLPGREVLERLLRIVAPYLVASLLGTATGLLRTRAPLWFDLATGSAHGIYYYVFVMAWLIPSIWPLSRMPQRAVEALLAALLLYLALASWRPTLLPLTSMFWGMRNPLTLAPCFLAGWIARAHRPRLARIARRRRGLVWAAALLTIVGYVAIREPTRNVALAWLARFAYTLAVIGVIALASSGRALPRAVRELGRATLTLYLHHILFYAAVGYLAAWAAWQRIPALVALGLVGGLGVASLGRALLGRRARWITGS